MFFDHRGHFLDRPDHRPQRFFHADAVDLAEQIEKLPLDRAQKADQPRDQPALHRVAFEVLDRVQADLAAELVLQLPSGEFGDQDFVFERADGKRERVGRDGDRGCR